MAKYKLGDRVLADKRFKGTVVNVDSGIYGNPVYCISVDNTFGDFYYGEEFLELLEDAPKSGLCECGGWSLEKQGWNNAHSYWCPAYRGKNKFSETENTDADD